MESYAISMSPSTVRGGARAIIEDGKNGFLVPVGDVEKLYQAMKRIVEDKELADRLSSNAVLLREELSLENIAKKWMELV
jgi:glycosyltransferase involved in cell wall biosynthesis